MLLEQEWIEIIYTEKVQLIEESQRINRFLFLKKDLMRSYHLLIE